MTKRSVPDRPGSIQRVRKRDGRVVPFQVDKIRDAIAAALEAEGRADPAFAGEVAAVVELTLVDQVRRGGEPVPGIEEIQDLVERALMELGRPEVAKAYILYRDRRARVREAVRVHRADAWSGGAIPVRVRETEGVSPWSKGRLVAALVEEAELPRESAEEVAAGVEKRVFASGLRHVTTGLVRELVAGELLARGWAHALASSGRVGLARHDLRRLLNGNPLQPWEAQGAGDGEPTPATSRRVADEVLGRFALEECLPGGLGELHRAGDLHVEDLGAPHLPLSMCVETQLLAAGGSSAQRAYGVLDGVGELARRVSRCLVLERPAEVLAPLTRSTRPGSALGLAGWLRALAAVSRAAGVRVHLGSPGARYSSFTVRLVEALAELDPDPHAPLLVLEGHELEGALGAAPELADALERLFADGRLLSAWGEPDERFAGPGCRRLRREPGILSCGGAIALNLPRLARRAGAWREDLVQSGLAELVQASLEIAGALDAFQRARAVPSSGGPEGAGLHARRSYAIVPVGLREALLQLGEGEIDPDQGARLLGLLAEAATRFGGGRSLAVAPEPFFGERAARRFAWLDHERRVRAGEQQHTLFADELAEVDVPRPYTPDLRLSPVGGGAGGASGRQEAEALRTLAAGALSMRGLPGLRDGEESHPHLHVWRRFEVLRRARSGEISLELFPVRPVPDETAHTAAALRPLA